MKFVGLVENHLPVAQDIVFTVCADFGFPFIHALEFPEIMTLSLVIKIISVFKIMYGIDLTDVKLFFQTDAFVFHDKNLRAEWIFR